MYIVGQEHVVLGQGDAVGRLADGDVYAELRPGHFREVGAQEVAHGGAEGQGAGVVGDLVEKSLVHDVADARGAVVVEKFVHVVLVLLASVFLQEVEQALTFFGS